ncbi:hypothetical protein [Marinomonas ostreistagni]|uniref:hypothetical protein n=1 Tax=Marinomonas ostreistagni TaxID=359209 RepID=UPI0019528AF9|nr:hypothetical protein [Marinomonas ostreistagni]MBM6549980.1 hypothetical protein [Marinomonas ostreistagni]
MKQHNLKIVSGVIALGLLSGCTSMLTDHGLDYQESEASDVTLQLPNDAQPTRDKLVIPNEDRIGDLTAKGEFEAPRAPLSFQPLAYAPLRLSAQQAVLQLPLDIEQSRTLMSDYLTQMAAAHDAEIELQVSDNGLSTSAFSLEEQGTLKKVWYVVTKLETPKYRFVIDFDEQNLMTQANIQVVSIKDGSESPVNLDKSDRFASLIVDMWTTFASEIKVSRVLLSDQSNVNRPLNENSPVWMRSNGELAFNLGNRFSERSFEAYIGNSDGVFLTGDNNQEISVVPAEQLAKVGDIIDFNLPVKSAEGEDGIKLFNVRRRNLDDVEWSARSYPYSIVRQQQGYFLTVDTSATDYPKLTSYRIFSRLAK